VKTIYVGSVTQSQCVALVQAAIDIEGGPWQGIHVGFGRHVPMAATVTENDIAKGSRGCIGWTYVGPQHGVINLTATLEARLTGPVIEPLPGGGQNIVDYTVLVRSPEVLTAAREAVAKAVAVLDVDEVAVTVNGEEVTIGTT